MTFSDTTKYSIWERLDFLFVKGESEPFKPYKNRFHVPYKASGSTSPLWYSIKRASAYVIVLSSYSAFGKYTPQTKWLEEELPRVNRSETPWLIVVMHSPLYSSYVHHYMEGEPMRTIYEPLLVQHKVDVVFSGHVHAYERSVSFYLSPCLSVKTFGSIRLGCVCNDEKWNSSYILDRERIKSIPICTSGFQTDP